MSSGSLRTFIAVDIPEGEVKEKIVESQKTLFQTGADLRLVEPENIHITMRFLGDITVSLVECLKTELTGIRFSPFKVCLKGVGVFPDYNRINVIWIGIGEGNIGLVDLYDKISRSLQKFRIPLDRRGLSLHMTLARVRSGKKRDILSKTVEELTDWEFGRIEVNSFHLKKSTLTPKGPIYESLCEVFASQP